MQTRTAEKFHAQHAATTLTLRILLYSGLLDARQRNRESSGVCSASLRCIGTLLT
jgi:hypothetical protein